ncbi:PEP-CTERM sorting domain-containing protein [Scytonema sp. NUACC26]|uniref:PEP-CTERM sorting domain-containing protein n=1 Tax=Scytonema sp. NUACC26 TaxID=3140176 RepID=UPI0038B3AB2E
MIVRLLQVWFLPLALTLVSVCLSVAKTSAQTVYPFTGNYRTTVNITPISGNISQVFEVGVSDDAPYGLELYEGLTYSVLDDNGNLTFNNNPEVFGIQNYPFGYIQFGNGINKLFGLSDASAAVNFETLTAKGSGLVYITDGEGLFENATATLLFSENDTVNLGSTITLNGLALVTGPIQVPQKVPEPTTNMTLFSMGLMGALWLRRRRSRSL